MDMMLHSCSCSACLSSPSSLCLWGIGWVCGVRGALRTRSSDLSSRSLWDGGYLLVRCQHHYRLLQPLVCWDQVSEEPCPWGRWVILSPSSSGLALTSSTSPGMSWVPPSTWGGAPPCFPSWAASVSSLPAAVPPRRTLPLGEGTSGRRMRSEDHDIL